MSQKNIVARRVTLNYPKLNKPDTKFNDDGEYTVQFNLDPKNEAHRAILSELKRRAEAAHAAAAANNPKKKKIVKNMPWQENEDGTFRIKAKQAAIIVPKKGAKMGQRVEMSVPRFDALGQPMDANIEIWSGTVANVSITTFDYFTPKGEAGASLRLAGVQIVDLVTRGGSNASGLGFGVEEDGFDSTGFTQAVAGDTSAGDDDEFAPADESDTAVEETGDFDAAAPAADEDTSEFDF